MPTRNAYIRYRAINARLKRGPATREDLMNACKEALSREQIAERTIDGDIYAMRNDEGLGFYAPIIFDRYQKAYRYEDDSYSIDNLPLNRDDMDTLEFAASVLRQYRNIGILENLQGSVQRLSDALHIRRLDRTRGNMDFIEFENQPLARGTEFLDPLIQCIREEQVIRLEYRSFLATKSNDYVLHPYLLKEYRNRWYLVALHDELREIRTFGLERIERIAPVVGKIYVKSDGDIRKVFRDTIGITRADREPVDIEVAFTELQAQYLTTQPLHPSQAFARKVNGRLHFRFTLVPTFEFTERILGWGAEVEVIGPAWYREEVAGKVRDMWGRYKEEVEESK